MSLGPLCFLLGEMSPQVLYPFVNWIVCLRGVKSCEFSLCSGHHSLVPVITGKCVFPYSWSPFHLLMVLSPCRSWRNSDGVPLVHCLLRDPWPKGENPGEKIAVWNM